MRRVLVAAVDVYRTATDKEVCVAVGRRIVIRPRDTCRSRRSDAVTRVEAADAWIVFIIVGVNGLKQERIDGAILHVDRQVAVVSAFDDNCRVVDIHRPIQVVTCQDKCLVRGDDRGSAGRSIGIMDVSAIRTGRTSRTRRACCAQSNRWHRSNPLPRFCP